LALDLEIQIEYQDSAALLMDAGNISQKTTVLLDTGVYDGATYYCEFVGENDTGTNYDMRFTFMDDAEFDDVLDIVIPSSATTPTRIRALATAKTGSFERSYDCQFASSSIIIYDARIIVVQSNATKTELQIAIGTESSTKTDSYSNPSNWGNAKRKFWYYDSSKFVTSGSTTVHFEAVLASSGSSNWAYCCVKLDGTTSALTNGEASVQGKTITRNRNTNGITLTNGEEYEGDIYSDATNKWCYVYAARLILRFTATISAIETVIRCGWIEDDTTPSGEDVGRRFLYNDNYEGTPTIYFEAMGWDNASDNDARLNDDGSNDSGTGGSEVTSSPVDFYNTTSPTRKRSSAITLTSGNRHMADWLTPDGGVSAWIIIQTVSGTTFYQTCSESPSTTAVITTLDVFKVLSENESPVDVLSSVWEAYQTLQETPSPTDAISMLIQIIESEEISPTDNIVLQVEKILSESESPTDIISTMDIGKVLSESISPTDALAILITKLLSELPITTDIVTAAIMLYKTLSESPITTDAVTQLIKKNISENQSPVDNITLVLDYIRTLSETPSPTDEIIKVIFTSLQENPATSDIISEILLQILLSEAPTTQDSIAKQLGLFKGESPVLSDTLVQGISLILSESETPTDAVTKLIELLKEESQTPVDTFDFELIGGGLFKTLTESPSVNDVITFLTEKSISESPVATDTIVKLLQKLLEIKNRRILLREESYP
jgi:hypothetical protein